jgi:hypothetical protein
MQKSISRENVIRGLPSFGERILEYILSPAVNLPRKTRLSARTGRTRVRTEVFQLLVMPSLSRSSCQPCASSDVYAQSPGGSETG